MSYEAATPSGHVLRARLAVVLGFLGEGGSEVLDAGMGPGRLCMELARRGFTVSGIDASAEMVAIAQSRLPQASGRLLQASIVELPFADGSFDAVVATGVLEYVGASPPVLAELARVLRPGGLAVVSVPNVRAPHVIWRRAVYYPTVRLLKRRLRNGRPAPFRRRRPPPKRRFVAMLETAGLTPESVRYAGYLLPFSPFDQLFPAMTVRIAERLEGGGPPLGSLLGGQMVVAARRRT